jgi:crotonobetainyl-CoA:carnitine CoA-transferase CaiB-like acyl-CoA transferase
MSFTGEPDGPPTKSGLSLVDLSGGYVAAIAMLSGLWRARRDGVGCDCDVSLFETALHELMYLGTWAATMGYEPRRMPESAHPSIVPFQTFATADGWVVVACAKQKFWEQLCRAIGREDLLADERFADFAGRDQHRDELLPILRREFKARSEAEWLELLSRVGVPHGRVNDVQAALADSQATARNAVIEIDHPRFGTVRQVASPLRVAENEVGRVTARAPFRGEHTEVVLAELCGYDEGRIAELRDDGVFGEESGVATRGERS